MKKYSTYKDSGVEWIGKIPEHWRISYQRYYLKTVADFTANGSFASLAKNVNYLEEGYSRLIRLTDLRKNLNNKGIFVSKEAHDFLAKSELKEGDILMANVGAYSGLVWRVPKLNYPATLAPNMFLFKFKSSIKEAFIFYLFNSKNWKEYLSLTAQASAQPKLNRDNIKELRLVLPPLDEQNLIIKYLDQKTTIIDSFLEKTKQKITTLQEQRTAIINQAVTKGLTHLLPAEGGTKGVPLKDSGVDLIGRIPKHWKTTRARYIGKTQNGISAGSDYFGSGFPFVSYSDVYKNATIPSQVKGLAQSPEKDRIAFSVEENDVFFTRTSETIEEIGIASTCIETIHDAVFAGFLIRFRPDSNFIYKGFSKYYFRCFIPRVFFVKEMNLVTRASLSQELLKRLPVLLPEIEEQKAIANYLDGKTTELDTLIQKEEQRINLLKEYRQSLISEVVTGKLCVLNEIPIT